MIISTVTGVDPLTIDQVRKHLNIEFIEDDDVLNSLIPISLNAVENYCREEFIQRDNVQDIGFFEQGYLPLLLTTDLTYKPFGNVTITYTEGTIEKTLEIPKLDQYNALKDHYYYIGNYITVVLQERINVDIDVSVSLSWQTGEDVIDVAITQARLLLCGTYYENRESAVIGASATELPQGVKYLLEPYMNPKAG